MLSCDRSGPSPSRPTSFTLGPSAEDVRPCPTPWCWSPPKAAAKVTESQSSSPIIINYDVCDIPAESRLLDTGKTSRTSALPGPGISESDGTKSPWVVLELIYRGIWVPFQRRAGFTLMHRVDSRSAINVIGYELEEMVKHGKLHVPELWKNSGRRNRNKHNRIPQCTIFWFKNKGTL